MRLLDSLVKRQVWIKYFRDLCIGCGACGLGCPNGALHLEPVSKEEWFQVPSSFFGWEEARIKSIGMKEK